MALLAEAELAVGAPPSQVVKTARVASKLCPDWGVPANLEGNALFHAEDLDGAEVAYRTALGLAPGIASSQFNMALIQIKRSDLAGAETALNSLLDAHPHHPNARLLRSQVRLQRKNLDGALDDARHAVAADAASAAAHALLGSVLTQTGAAEAGREALCKARALGHPSGAKLCPSTP
jgi:Flp pilus assembly protein TadD